jgi:hypothetical protein
VKHPAIPSDTALDKDDNHPIPTLSNIDFVVALEGRGAYYGLVVASPLGADKQSQDRLIKKIEIYLNDFLSAETKREIGAPSLDKTRIYVVIHPKSHPAIFELLRRCRNWTESNKIGLDIDTELSSFKADDIATKLKNIQITGPTSLQ